MLQKDDRIEKILEMTADIQKFDELPDGLTQIVRDCEETELSLDELDYVAAASSAPIQSFRRFMEMMENKQK